MYDYEDIEEELFWEQHQIKITQAVKIAEAKGWGYSVFKAVALDYLSDEEEIVSAYQDFLLKKEMISPDDFFQDFL